MSNGQIRPDRDPTVETDRILALTGFATLIELDVVEPPAALVAIDAHLDRLFVPMSPSPFPRRRH